MPKKVGAWSESKGWSGERKFKNGRSAERRRQKGSERGALFTPGPPHLISTKILELTEQIDILIPHALMETRDFC